MINANLPDYINLAREDANLASDAVIAEYSALERRPDADAFKEYGPWLSAKAKQERLQARFEQLLFEFLRQQAPNRSVNRALH